MCTCYICTGLGLGIGFLDYARASYNLYPIRLEGRIGIWGCIQFTDSVIVCNEAKSSFTFTDPVDS